MSGKKDQTPSLFWVNRNILLVFSTRRRARNHQNWSWTTGFFKTKSEIYPDLRFLTIINLVSWQGALRTDKIASISDDWYLRATAPEYRTLNFLIRLCIGPGFPDTLFKKYQKSPNKVPFPDCKRKGSKWAIFAKTKNYWTICFLHIRVVCPNPRCVA